MLYLRQEQPQLARRVLNEALQSISEETGPVVDARLRLAMVACHEAQPEEARQVVRSCLAFYRRQENLFSEFQALDICAIVEMLEGAMTSPADCVAASTSLAVGSAFRVLQWLSGLRTTSLTARSTPTTQTGRLTTVRRTAAGQWLGSGAYIVSLTRCWVSELSGTDAGERAPCIAATCLGDHDREAQARAIMRWAC